jgi:predicted RNase H-like nuclease
MNNNETWVAGVDGYPDGWVVVNHPLNEPLKATVHFFEHFEGVVALSQHVDFIAVDIPIGLPERTGRGGRVCDSEARKIVRPRGSSVFSVPARMVFTQPDYRTAKAVALRCSDPPRSISIFIWCLFPKINEVDVLMKPSLQSRIYECHPELVFWRLNQRRPLQYPKKRKSRAHPEGTKLRRRLLNDAGYSDSILDDAIDCRGRAGIDDVIDAFAGAVAATGIARGQRHRVPDDPPCDAKGLRMEIWG